jgi:hypothetical protein
MLRSFVAAVALLVLSTLVQAATLPAPVLTVKTGGSITLSWVAPIANTDGSAISGTLSYNLYTVTATGSTSLQTGITGLTNQRTNLNAGTPCYALTAVENGIESSPTNPVCVTVTAGPNAPTSISVSITITATSP